MWADNTCARDPLVKEAVDGYVYQGYVKEEAYERTLDLVTIMKLN